MAKMYPEVFPGKFDQANPEFVVYQCLRKLPDSYVVLYSRRFTGGLLGKPECEIDFIVSNQRDVIICIEVKGGVIAYDGAQDQWHQNGQLMSKAPDRQATAATHVLLRELHRELQNVNVEWALCFPQCTLVDDKRPSAIPLNRILDETRLNNITTEFPKLEQEVRAAYRRTGIATNEAKALIDRLTRSIGFVQILGVRIAREADQIVQVTQEQCDVLADLEVNRQMLVHGSAGTGKTILAQEFAKRLAGQGRTVLMLFYNRGIAAKVRSAFERHSGVTVSTFSSFAKRLVEANDPEWWAAQSRKDDEFWHLVLPTKLLEIPAAKHPKFQAVIVDEGQDFKPEWYEYLQTLLVPGESSRYCVFLDEHQDIFGHWKHFPCTPAPAKKVLTRNCRNTRTIVDFLNTAYPTNMTCFERSPVGTPVVQRVTRNAVEEQTQIVRDIKYLIQSEHIKPGSIVILLNTPKEQSCLAETKAIAGFPLESTFAGYTPVLNKVYYSTIEIFKGLEADVVLLIAPNQTGKDEISKTLYVKGSRAKHVLYVYRRIAN